MKAREYRKRIVVLMMLVVISIVIIWSLTRFDIIHREINDVQFTREQLLFLKSDYSGDIEKVYCLQGAIKGDVAIVKKIHIPEQLATVASVEFGECPGLSTIGMLHTHPGSDCYFSSQDLYTFGKTKLPVLGVMCEDGMVFYNNQLRQI